MFLTPSTRESAVAVVDGWAVELQLRRPIRELGGSEISGLFRPRGHSLCCEMQWGGAAPRRAALDARRYRPCHAMTCRSDAMPCTDIRDPGPAVPLIIKLLFIICDSNTRVSLGYADNGNFIEYNITIYFEVELS